MDRSIENSGVFDNRSGGPTTIKTAPIALFVYKRPHHVRETVAHLQKNGLARDSDLYVFCDGPRTTKDVDAVNNVRQCIHNTEGFRSVTVVERDTNFGLAKSIITGVTQLCQQHGRAIVLEDDLVVSPYFLDYMNRALWLYEDDNRVMNITGYMLPVKNPEKLPESFFCYASSSWGWATWERAWGLFEEDTESLFHRVSKSGRRREFDIEGTMPFMEMLRAQADGKIISWAIRWYATTFLHHGLCLHPSRSLVRNIGHDGSGSHCGPNTDFDVMLSQAPIREFPREASPCEAAVWAMADYYESITPPLSVRAFKQLWRKLTF
jgi:hypothetical protein